MGLGSVKGELGVKQAVIATVEVRPINARTKLYAVDCAHSRTEGYVIDGEKASLTKSSIIVGLCHRALAETPCACVEALLARYQEGF